MGDERLGRRDFVKTTAAVGAGLLTGAAVPAKTPSRGRAKSCILMMLTGGPSQLDTWDPKPEAPSEVRGPFSPIRTSVPGLILSELFPKMAAMADQFSLIRCLHHEFAPIHEIGFQLLNTGRRLGDGPAWPSVGVVAGDLLGWPVGAVVTPDRRVRMGLNVDLGQGAGFLRSTGSPENRNHLTLGRNCDEAVKAVENGSHFVTINHYLDVFDSVSWDCHADEGSLRTTLDDYRTTVAPSFDAAYTKLLTDLRQRGLLDSALVVAVGEFGRTPRVNRNGGRDHWANCWTALVAGGGVQGGRVVGASDAIGGEPNDRPVSCPELAATIYHALGIPTSTTFPGPTGSPVRVVDAAPVWELF